MLAVSTSWDYKPDLNVAEWIAKIKALGVNAIELGYSLNKQQADQFVQLIPREGIKVVSIHNFCPTPFDEPSARHVSNHYRLSSIDEEERKKAVYWTCHTIDTARAVNAGVVVIHAGTVEILDDSSRELIAMYKDGAGGSSAFKELAQKTMDARARCRAPFVAALTKSLDEVLVYAQKYGIKIGLETRYYPFEMPNFEEVGLFLNQFKGRGLYYWHDVGHAETNERLTIKPHLDFLNAYKKELIGVHLHGIRVLRDHLAVFDGDMDIEPKLEFFGKGIIKVIESRYGNYEQLKEDVKRLRQRWPHDD